ncbi:HNH endonuclease [Clostridium putrefaciens]|uniref:HNH endonuclease n=1 Tax=Clostridium putrefaciens TaxID=99675 RepID=A0A381JAB5_9CLOT|nr:HNH endonuclease [Clostridium putrefaciens]SUY48151.1 HNH endonuclease [Clostridium putrefaciens]
MGFPKSIQDTVLVKCKRHCCLCGRNVGINIELHHIRQKADGGDDSEDNCIPLCFDCHASVKSYNKHHPKGHKYSENEIKQRREKFYEDISNIITSMLLSNDDYNKLENVMNNYGVLIESMIELDPCTETVSINFIDNLEGVAQNLKSFKYDFSNVDLEESKCIIIDKIHEIICLLYNTEYFHSLNDGRICFNNYSVNNYRKEMYNMRLMLRNAYLVFRNSM